MPEVRGKVVFGDHSPASGHRVSGMASGAAGGMIDPVYTDSRGEFILTWNSSATSLARLYVDGKSVRQNVSGDVGTIKIS